MKTNREILRESLARTRTGKWFWRALLVMLLLGSVNNTANTLVEKFYQSREIHTWFGYITTKVASLVGGLDCAVPSRAVAWQMSEATAFALFIATIFAGIMLFGVSSVMLKAARHEESGWFTRSFGGFARPLGLAWLGVTLWVRVALWSLLFVVPGIVAGYRYSQCWNIKVEHPDWSAGQCLAESARMMRGHKLQRFLLDLVFVAMVFVIALVLLGVGLAGGLTEDADSIAAPLIILLVVWPASMFIGIWLSIARAIFYTSLPTHPE